MERTYRRGIDRFRLSRPAAGVAALVYPLSLIGVMLSSGFRSVGDLGETAVSVLGALLFLIAAPTSWVFAIEFIDVSRFTVVAIGAMTSLPLWFLVGAGLSAGVRTWADWLGRFLVVASLWTLANLILFGLVGVIVG